MREKEREREVQWMEKEAREGEPVAGAPLGATFLVFFWYSCSSVPLMQLLGQLVPRNLSTRNIRLSFFHCLDQRNFTTRNNTTTSCPTTSCKNSF